MFFHLCIFSHCQIYFQFFPRYLIFFEKTTNKITDDFKMILKYKNRLISAHSIKKNRIIFLTECIYEKVIPISTSNVLRSSHLIFPECIKFFLESSIENLKFSEDSAFEKAIMLGMNLRNKKCMSHKTSEKLKMEISNLNNTHISKLKQISIFM